MSQSHLCFRHFPATNEIKDPQTEILSTRNWVMIPGVFFVFVIELIGLHHLSEKTLLGKGKPLQFNS